MCNLNIFLSSLLLICYFAVCCISQKISEKKCQEYAKYVYEEEDSPVMLRKLSKEKVSRCGLVEVPLVIGGIKAQEKEFPHMAVLGYKSPSTDIEWKCGGSLISENFILSASHCIPTDNEPIRVRLGVKNLLQNKTSFDTDYDIIRITKHPKYKRPSKYNDIALLKLGKSVQFNAYIRPACLNTAISISQKKVIAAGFGKTAFYNEKGSLDLMKVTLDVITNSACEEHFKNEKTMGTLSDGISENLVCAGFLEGGKDTCQGDSGGPLQEVLSDPYCMYNIIGVVSFGKYCGFANQPAIYTNVAYYIPWIESIVWPQ